MLRLSSTPRPAALAAPRRSTSSLRVVAAAAPRDPTSSLQLATAKLPAKADKALFARTLFNWSASITTNGRNMPLSLPLKVDRNDQDDELAGVTMSLLRVLGEAGSAPISVADLVISIEEAPGASNGVLMVSRKKRQTERSSSSPLSTSTVNLHPLSFLPPRFQFSLSLFINPPTTNTTGEAV